MKRSRLLACCAPVMLALGAGCRTGYPYEDPGPRYAGVPADSARARPSVDTLRVVSFNIEFSLRVDSAISVLLNDPAVRGADIILLQEMDEASTRQVADTLHMYWTYYPAVYHLMSQRDLGNAVLSRWPIAEDHRLLLPHTGRFGRTRRIATAATIQLGAHRLRVYSTHLGTISDVGPNGRRAQLQAIVADAERYPLVIIGGDMNSGSVGGVAKEAGYAWPTLDGPSTSRGGRLDHLFLRGFVPTTGDDAGTVLDVRRASDHLPVWAIAVLPRAVTLPAAADSVRGR